MTSFRGHKKELQSVITCPVCGYKKKILYRLMPAYFSINAKTVKQQSAPKKGTVVCFAVMEQ